MAQVGEPIWPDSIAIEMSRGDRMLEHLKTDCFQRALLEERLEDIISSVLWKMLHAQRVLVICMKAP